MRSPSASVRRAQPLLGTFVEVCARGPRARLDAAVSRAFGAIGRIHALMSFHESGSDVWRLNRLAHRASVGVDPHTFAVLTAARQVAEASGGAFDVTMAPALTRFGFLPALTQAPPATRPGGFRAIELLPGERVRFTEPAWIDLGGIAKGYAVDLACATLEEDGITDYLVNAGGDLRVGSEPRPVEVRHPARPGLAVPLGSFVASALATSAAYFSGREGPTCDLHPIIAPARGEPARYHGSISVQAPGCTEADALTKVVAVLGPDAAPALRRFDANAWRLSATGEWHSLAPAPGGAPAAVAGRGAAAPP